MHDCIRALILMCPLLKAVGPNALDKHQTEGKCTDLWYFMSNSKCTFFQPNLHTTKEEPCEF